MTAYSSYQDLKLIALFREGDERAYVEIYARYIGSLTRFAESKLYSLEDARDLIQDLFTGLWAERFNLEIQDNLKSYLFGAVRHQIINKIRKKVVREDYAAKLRALSPAYASLEEELDARELDSNIRGRIEALPEKTRKIYKLSREENESIKDIAEAMDLSEQTVKNQISIALKHLRKSLSSFFFSLF